MEKRGAKEIEAMISNRYWCYGIWRVLTEYTYKFVKMLVTYYFEHNSKVEIYAINDSTHEAFNSSFE